MKLALVIVDVPTQQTDNPYTYEIPANLQNDVQVGMRVVVPFGHRFVEGFVVGFTDHSQYQLKPLRSIMDLTPVVDPELLTLSKWLAQATYSFRINCLLTMLPSVMRAKYEKQLTLNPKAPQTPAIKKLFGGQPTLTYRPQQLNAAQVKLILQLKRKNWVKIDYLVKNQARVIKVKAFKNQLPMPKIIQLLQKTPSRYKGQQDLLTYLMGHNQEISEVSKVTKQTAHITNSVIDNAEKAGWLKTLMIKKDRNPYHQPVKKNQPFRLNSDQEAAFEQITTALGKQQARVFLLEGVTGSGKTEVYLQVIQKALETGKTALMLVPEISLTPQMVNWVKGRFGNLVAILHSGLSAGEKYDEWRRIRAGQAKVVVGARSAIFAPLKNIGVIIMDEEHDASYKQGNTPRYQTREVAKWRGKYHGCPVVLGSATPTLESRARAMKGVYQLLRLPHRINHQVLPAVHIVDMRKEIMLRHETNFSKPLLEGIKQRIARHEQVILMLNRRGYSNFMMCRNCGYVPKCPNCDISLTYHKGIQRLKCHYCGHEEPVPQVCPRCHSPKIKFFGTGTEQAQAELQKLIPSVKIVRMDVDTTSRKGSHAKLLREFGHGQANVLLGTQMIAKGLDFPNVTLVGVLNADTALELPDFRAEESTFQLLTQVSGRAGRANKKGEVFIQTFNPDNYAIRLAQQQDYEKFYRIEMKKRHQLSYPPYYFTIRIVASAVQQNNAARGMYAIRQYLQKYLTPQAIILGPAPSTIARIKRRYYYQLVIKYKREPYLQAALNQILNRYQAAERQGLLIAIDPAPQGIL